MRRNGFPEGILVLLIGQDLLCRDRAILFASVLKTTSPPFSFERAASRLTSSLF